MLYRWLRSPDSRFGIHVLTPNGQWRHTPYDELAGLVAATVQRGTDRVIAPSALAVCCEDPRNFVVGLYSALLTGARVGCLPPPAIFGGRSRYEAMLTDRIRLLKPDLVLSDPATQEILAGVTPPGTPLVPVAERAGGPLPGRAADNAAIVQFTSGSTSAGKGVIIRARALESNIAAITEWLGLAAGDGTSSWLPLHHDMGLVGCLLTPLTGQRPIWLMSPQQFIRRPEMWLSTFRDGATTTAAPPFGYEYCVQRVGRETALDLSRWRVAIIGAERIREHVLRSFTDRFAADGFSSEAFLPSYGLAEATLAVTGRRPANPVRGIEVDSGSVRHGGNIRPVGHGGPERSGVRILGCGLPLRGCQVEIRDLDGATLEPGGIGEIVVRGTALGRYYSETSPHLEGTHFREGALWTGDLGFIDSGELFCIGRIGDGIKVRGKFVAAEMIEHSITDRLGLMSGLVVALLGTRGDNPHLALLLDRRAGVDPGEVHRAARAATAGITIDVTVCLCPHRVIERTSSGKPRRRSMWSAFVSGAYDEHVVTAQNAPLVAADPAH